jgi:hypothetical protein
MSTLPYAINIALDSIKSQLSDTAAVIITPTFDGYGDAIKGWSATCEKNAVHVLLSSLLSDIRTCLTFAAVSFWGQPGFACFLSIFSFF